MDDPLSTYRIQLNKDFTFDDAEKIVSYLHELGISHLYLSPAFESTPGSNHGYDVTDHLKISDERGGLEKLKNLDRALSKLDRPMKMILDIVPNHMAASVNNPYWYDILKNGQNSPHWPLFDMRVPKGQKIKLPVLGENVQDEILAGHIAVEDYQGKQHLRVNDDYYPLKDNTSFPQHDHDQFSPADIKDIIDQQHYSLEEWHLIFDEISYRRFFDIIGLVGVRVEDDAIYKATNAFILDLKKNLKTIDGVRVDHIDGLSDPAKYLKQLHADFDKIWIEKILAIDEGIPADWPVSGTTGYEFISQLNALFTDADGYQKIEKFWHSYAKPAWSDFEECVMDSKEYVLENLFPAELKRLSNAFDNKSLAHDFWHGLTVCLPVYRTYYNGRHWSPADEEIIKQSFATARKKYGPRFSEAERYMQDAFFSNSPKNPNHIIQDWQQLSGPAMAKGLEDTAHYRYTPLLCLNEVGCAPDSPLIEPVEFVKWINSRAQEYPDSMNGTSTHDTKRSEDTRQRLYALSTMSEEWIEYFKAVLKIPDQSFEHVPAKNIYFTCQTIISVWPLNNVIDNEFIERIKAYSFKALKEAKEETSWPKPNPEFDESIMSFVESLLKNKNFQILTQNFVKILAPRGAILSLSALTLKILNPGIPDFYRGCEVWQFDLVDPDNRRPIDYAQITKMFRDLKNVESLPAEKILSTLCQEWQSGAVKLWLIKHLLNLRQQLDLSHPVASIKMTGKRRHELMSYQIKGQDPGVYYIITLPIRITDEPKEELRFPETYWEDTAILLPHYTGMEDCFTNASHTPQNHLMVQDCLNHFPVSILKMSV